MRSFKIKRPSEMTEEDWAKIDWDLQLSPEETAEVYRLSREALTAADLQEFTELDPGLPADGLLAELEEIQRQHHEHLQGNDKQS